MGTCVKCSWATAYLHNLKSMQDTDVETAVMTDSIFFEQYNFQLQRTTTEQDEIGENNA